LSHDEVVHGKGSLLEKMPGDRWQKFANLRMFLAWMWMHPGKKLLFMGGEIGQWREWSHERELDWEVLLGSEHSGLKNLVTDLNKLYISRPSLHRLDHESGGFWWLEANDWERSIFAFARTEPNGEISFVVVNATPVPRPGYRLGVTQGGFYKELLNSDSIHYAGSDMGNLGGVNAVAQPWQGQPWSIEVNVPPLGVVVFGKE